MVRRYRPERPLPSRPYRLGAGERPLRPAHGPGDFEWGVDLFNAGCYWEAHEEWEELWNQSEPGSAARELLQGLIACAAAALQGIAGRWQGARRLVARAGHRFEAAGTDLVLGVDTGALLAACHAMVLRERLDPPLLIVLVR